MVSRAKTFQLPHSGLVILSFVDFIASGLAGTVIYYSFLLVHGLKSVHVTGIYNCWRTQARDL